MNKFLTTAVIILVAFRLCGQDCTSAQDCLQKGKNYGYDSKTLEYYDKALKLAKKEGVNPSEIYQFRGINNYNLYTPDYKEATKDFNAAIKADPKNLWAYLWLANVYAYGEKDYKKANDYLGEVLNKFPNDVRVFRERANLNKYYNNLNLATTDYEMAYNLVIDDPSSVDAWTAAEIVRWHAELSMRSKNMIFADESIVSILEKGLKAAPNDAKLMGELALAYYDIDQKEKAIALGKKAYSIDQKNVGSLFVAIELHDTGDYYGSSALMYEVKNAALHAHPLIYYYFCSALWAHIYKNAQHLWAANKAQIQSNLEGAVQLGANTKYDWYAQEAKKMLANIGN
jgi:tetratricopeptide (TPR) repeat protein